MPARKKAVKKTAATKKPTTSGQSPRSMNAQSTRMMAQALTEITGLPVSIGGNRVSGSGYKSTAARKRSR